MTIKALIFRLIGDRKREPARLITRGASLVTGVVGLSALWGLDISDAKQTAILTTMSTVIPVLVTVGEVIRPYVTPTVKAERKITEAYYATPGKVPKPTL